MKDLIIPEQNELDKMLELGSLPSKAARLYGCTNCEWKITGLCPYGFKKGAGHSEKGNSHSHGICIERRNWLLSFSQADNSRPSFSQWLHDFNQGLGQIQMNKDYAKLQYVEEQMAQLSEEIKNSDCSPKEKDRLKKGVAYERNLARTEWFELWKTLMGNSSRTMDRETAKKIRLDVSHKINLSEIHKLAYQAKQAELGEEVIDVENEFENEG